MLVELGAPGRPEKRQRQQLAGLGARAGVHLEHGPDDARDHRAHFGEHRVRVVHLAAQNELFDPRVIQRRLAAECLFDGMERRLAREQHVENHPRRPNVHFVAVAVAEHLGRHVVDRAALRAERLGLVFDLRQAQVDDFDAVRGRALEQNVLGLEVAVHWVSPTDAVVVHVRQRLEQLHHDAPHEPERHRLALPGHAVEKLAAVQELHHDENIRRVDVVLENLDHVDVVDFDQQLDFPANVGGRVA